jgi:hypothetical protein
MSFAIEMPEHLCSWMEVLPQHTCTSIHLMLARIAELAAHWPPEDWRWKQIAYRDEQGMRFYVRGCCVRFSLEPETRRVVVRGLARVVVPLASGSLDSTTDSEGSPAQQ